MQGSAKALIELTARASEFAGIAVMVLGALAATVAFVGRTRRRGVT
jgi:hypothetical protein